MVIVSGEDKKEKFQVYACKSELKIISIVLVEDSRNRVYKE